MSRTTSKPCPDCGWPNSLVVHTIPPHTLAACKGLREANELDAAGFVRSPARAITASRILGRNFENCIAAVYLATRRLSNRPSHDAYSSWHIAVDHHVVEFVSYVYSGPPEEALGTDWSMFLEALRTHDMREILLPILRFTADPAAAVLTLADRLPHARKFEPAEVPNDRIWWPAASQVNDVNDFTGPGRSKSRWLASRLAAWLKVQPQHVDASTRFKLDLARTWAAAYQSGYVGESHRGLTTPESALYMMAALPWPYRALKRPKDYKEHPGYRLLHDPNFDPASWTPYGSRAEEVSRRKKRCNGRKSSAAPTSTNS